MRQIRINAHLNGHNIVPNMPVRLGAARFAAFFAGFLGALRGLGAGLLRFSATKGDFDPRLPVILLTHHIAPFPTSLACMIHTLIPKVELRKS